MKLFIAREIVDNPINSINRSSLWLYGSEPNWDSETHTWQLIGNYDLMPLPNEEYQWVKPGECREVSLEDIRDVTGEPL